MLPVLLLHFFFLNYSVQDFTVLYASLFFSVLLGILYDKVKKSGAVPIRALQVGLVVTVMIFIGQYYLMNYRIDTLFAQSVGRDIITKNSTKDDVIFWPEEQVEPQLVFYAQRNIKYVKTPDDAKAFLINHGLKQGVIFYVHDRGYLFQKVSPDSIGAMLRGGINNGSVNLYPDK